MTIEELAALSKKFEASGGKLPDNPTPTEKIFFEIYYKVKGAELISWLQLNFIKSSEICYLLYGTKDRAATGKFSQKKNGHVKWTKEELEKLEQIRLSFIEMLKKNNL